MRKKEPKIVKAVRLSVDMLELLDKKSKKSGKTFSEMIRRAIVAQYVKPRRTKNK